MTGNLFDRLAARSRPSDVSSAIEAPSLESFSALDHLELNEDVVTPSEASPTPPPDREAGSRDVPFKSATQAIFARSPVVAPHPATPIQHAQARIIGVELPRPVSAHLGPVEKRIAAPEQDVPRFDVTLERQFVAPPTQPFPHVRPVVPVLRTRPADIAPEQSQVPEGTTAERVVHVTIGRIDVKAGPPVHVTAASAGPTEKARTLAEYLGSRTS